MSKKETIALAKRIQAIKATQNENSNIFVISLKKDSTIINTRSIS